MTKRKPKPHLKLVRCYRGRKRAMLADMVRVGHAAFRKIQKGPLKGCFRCIGEGMRPSIWYVHQHFMLEFKIVIRVDLDAK